MNRFLKKVNHVWSKIWWIAVILFLIIVIGLFVLAMNGNPIKEKEIGKRLEIDLERIYLKDFDLEYTRYDATRSEYGAIFRTNESIKKDNVSFYATYHNEIELYDTYLEEIFSRDIRKALTKEAKEVYGDNFHSIEVSSPPELFIDDEDRKNVQRYEDLSTRSMKNVEIMVNVRKDAKKTVRKDLAKLAVKMKNGSMKAGQVIVMGAEDEKVTGFGSWVWLNVTKLKKDFTMSEFNQLLEWDETFKTTE